MIKLTHISYMADKSVPYRSAHGAFWVLPFQFRSFACSSKTEQCHNGWCSNALESWIVYSHVAMQAPRTIKLKCYLQTFLNDLSAHCASNQIALSHFFDLFCISFGAAASFVPRCIETWPGIYMLPCIKLWKWASSVEFWCTGARLLVQMVSGNCTSSVSFHSYASSFEHQVPIMTHNSS